MRFEQMSKCNSLNANHHYSFHSFENISHFRRQKNLVLGQWCQPRLEQPSFLFKYLLEFPKILRRKPSLFGAFARWMGQNKMRLQELLHLWGTKSCRHANSIGPCRLAVTALIVYQSGKWYFQRGKFQIHRLHICRKLNKCRRLKTKQRTSKIAHQISITIRTKGNWFFWRINLLVDIKGETMGSLAGRVPS